MNQWFEVDRKGLAEVARRRGMAFIVSEPIQNAWDEDITHVSVDMEPVPGKAQVRLIVSDDSPDGFRDLADAYVMFRQSYKLANPEQRGRFNIGEKLLLAVADEARIQLSGSWGTLQLGDEDGAQAPAHDPRIGHPHRAHTGLINQPRPPDERETADEAGEDGNRRHEHTEIAAGDEEVLRGLRSPERPDTDTDAQEHVQADAAEHSHVPIGFHHCPPVSPARRSMAWKRDSSSGVQNHRSNVTTYRTRKPNWLGQNR